MKRKYITFFSVAVAVVLFVAFERSGLEEIRIIGAALSLYHLKHFCGVVCGLVNRFMEV